MFSKHSIVVTKTPTWRKVDSNPEKVYGASEGTADSGSWAFTLFIATFYIILAYDWALNSRSDWALNPRSSLDEV